MTYNDDINTRNASDYYEEAGARQRVITTPLSRAQKQGGPTFNINRQVAAHPWAAVGLAVAAGFALGNTGENQVAPRYSAGNYGASHSANNGFWTDVRNQFDEQIDVLKTAAIATAITSLRDLLGEISPAAQQTLSQAGFFGGAARRSPSYSGNTSYSSNTSTGNTSYNSNMSSGGPSYTSGNVHTSGASYTSGSGSGSSAPTTNGTMSDTNASARINDVYATGISSDADSDAPAGGRAPSSAPNTSMDTGGGTVGFDSPPVTSSQLSNPETRGTEHEDPYYPPGGASGSITGDKNRR